MAGKSTRDVRNLILKVMVESDGPVGGARIAEALRAAGVVLQPRSVRFHLLRLDADGFTRFISRRQGRELTPEGRQEVQRSDVMGKVGWVSSKVDALGYAMTFDPRRQCGTVVANVCILDARDYARAMVHVVPVFQSGYSLGRIMGLAVGGETFAGYSCPRGRTILAPVCSVSINGMLLKAGIPVTSRFGGLLEIRDRRPVRFVELIEYSGTSVDPLALFIRAGMTQVKACAVSGTGLIGASFREFPSAALSGVRDVVRSLDTAGLQGVVAIGRPGLPLLGVPVTEGRTGLVVVGGLNPMAALREEGIPMEIRPLAGLDEFGRFRDVDDLARLGRRRITYVE